MSSMTLRLEIVDASQVASVRRAASEAARHLGFDQADAGRAALLATEAASNIFKHAGRGQLLLRSHGGVSPLLELLAVDAGPGFDAARASEDGYSTSGTMGGGLGAMKRMSSEFDVYAQAGRGSVLRMAVRPTDAAATDERFTVGAVSLPHPGETVCGDGWAMRGDGMRALIVVVDGLGHGPEAHRAAQAATAALPRPDTPVQHVLESAHAALRATRGAAMAVAAVDLDAQRVSYAGVGNIAGLLSNPDSSKHMVSLAGIVGHNVRKVQPFDYPVSTESLLVMHSDGLGTHWSLNDYPGLRACHPSTIAAVLVRDHARGRDDVTVLVARFDTH
jgi:anti-sigma regulatory factor (Ser/Thr protein kinase)